MKFTLSWLKDYLDTKASTLEICNKLTDIGLEVEEIHDKARDLAPFTVAQILEANPHPDSKKLKICKVETGSSSPLQIICGAANARSGLKVAYAPIGSVIPANKMVIKKAKIAGVESFGMLCSASELGIGSDGEGIIEIDNEAKIGSKISDVLGLNEAVVEVNVTPNRGDALGIYGIARDLAASGIGTLKSIQNKEIKGGFSSPIKIQIADGNCKYFSGYYIKNLKNQKSPKWLQERLEAIGLNPITAIVDITNYVMFCLNRPLHAYDADKLKGNIIVRKAASEEKFKSLKNIDYQLSNEELVIADNSGAIGLAGIVGGLETSVLENTQNIFLEAAFFDAENIARTGRRLNILSDARFRFERGVDLSFTKFGLDFAANLILEICGGEISEIVEAGSDKEVPVKINFDLTKIKRILGIEIAPGEALKILENLGFKCSAKSGQTYEVTVPSFRSDVKIAEDLIEEIIRIHGYNQISSLPLSNSKISAPENNISILQNTLCASGADEIISFSFIDSKIAALFAPQNSELLVINPIASDMDYMRPSLIPGLVLAARKNRLRGFENLSFFEIGRIFSGSDINAQKNSLAVLKVGKNKERNYFNDDRDFDILDVKKDLFDCLAALGFSANAFQISEEVPNYYHPYRSASLKLGKNIIGYFGQLNPLINKKMDIAGKINICELFLENLPGKSTKKSTSKKPFIVSDFQAVKRDFAFVVNKEIKAGDVIKTIEKIDPILIKEVNLFDIYVGDKIDQDKKSLALEVKIQPLEKTLTSEEIETISNKIISLITTQFSAVLRN